MEDIKIAILAISMKETGPKAWPMGKGGRFIEMETDLMATSCMGLNSDMEFIPFRMEKYMKEASTTIKVMGLAK